MRPALRPGDLVLVLPAGELRRGDVVVVRDPRDPSRETVKRITAVPGDVADLPDGPAAVPAGQVAVQGDNALRSTDSRTFGAVPERKVAGRVTARLWPHPRPLTRPC